MAWEDNKNTIIGRVNDGTASAAEQAWYDTWVAAGRPETQDELQLWKSQNTGAEQGEPVTYWNPEKGIYQTDPFDPSANYKPGDDYGYYLNRFGDYVYGKMPEETHQYYDGDGYTTVEGPDPRPSNPPPSTGGMAPGGGQYYGDPNDPDNTGNLEDQPGYQPPVDYDPFEDPTPGGYIPPEYTPYVPDPDAVVPGDTPPVDGGGTTPSPGGGLGDLFDIPLQGWEASTNKDFYQDQFRDMLMRREGEGMKEFAAAIRRQEAENAPAPEMGDPWAWAGGESQFAPTVGTGFDATWTMPDQYQGLDNASIIAMQGNDYLSKHPDFLAQAPEFNLENRESVLAYLNSNPYTNDKGWTQAVNDFGRGLYTQLGDTVGGLPVPEGYASPI